MFEALYNYFFGPVEPEDDRGPGWEDAEELDIFTIK